MTTTAEKTFGEFREKSTWQKDDCLFCEDKSTLEAVCGSALVRCCDKQKCKNGAQTLARLINSKHKPTHR